MEELNSLVIDLSRGTTHDGPGMRTTVFFKGCPLNCDWCQNPEGIRPEQEIWWEERKCIRCLGCLEACPQGAISEEENSMRRDSSRCEKCGACVAACPARAMAYASQEWTIGALLKEVLKDRDYFAAFHGGVTASGGEPLRQHRFVSELFRLLHEQGIHTALDTCGLASKEALRAVLPYTDHILFDIKFIDPGLHQRFTGRSNEIILDNLNAIAIAIRKRTAGEPVGLWIRTPLIPGATATEENLAAIGAYIRANLADVVDRWELCAFNRACVSKYRKMGLTWMYENQPLMAQAEVDRLRDAAISAGVSPQRLVVSGLIVKERM